MWSDRDLEEQYVPDHLMNHLSSKPKENGIDYRHALSSHENLDSHNHLLGHGGDMLTDAMLGHIGDQVGNNSSFLGKWPTCQVVRS